MQNKVADSEVHTGGLKKRNSMGFGLILTYFEAFLSSLLAFGPVWRLKKASK